MDEKESALATLRAALQVVYDDLASDVARAGPVCELSGRCCRFAEYDHTLFLSACEAELLLADAPPPVRALDEGQTCPWQDVQGRCTAREARPLGCRVYYCDPSYQHRSHELSELYLAKIRRIAEETGRPWGYAPLHTHLREAQSTGRFPPAESSLSSTDVSF